MRFLIVDGYPEHSRAELEAAGVPPAWRLYAEMLKQRAPDATHEVLFPADNGVSTLSEGDLARFQGVLWTGSNLTIHHPCDERVDRQVELARRCYRVGVPAFGSCWGIQIAAVAAGGRVEAHPGGREMFLARKIRLTEEGRSHPMFAGKPLVYDGFISHLDEVTGVPEGGTVLAGNDFTGIQALAVVHQSGTFWATQYHPEYTLKAMSRLFVARKGPLMREGFFQRDDQADLYMETVEALAREPHRKDLRFQLAIDDDVCDDDVRQREFVNWLEAVVKGPEK